MQVSQAKFTNGDCQLGRSRCTEHSTKLVSANINKHKKQINSDANNSVDLINPHTTEQYIICDRNINGNGVPEISGQIRRRHAWDESNHGNQFCEISANKPKIQEAQHKQNLVGIPESSGAELDSTDGTLDKRNEIYAMRGGPCGDMDKHSYCKNKQKFAGNVPDNFEMGTPSVQRSSQDIDMDRRNGQQLGRFSNQQLGRFNKQELRRFDKQLESLKDSHMDNTSERTCQNSQNEADYAHSHGESETESSGETATASSIAVLAERLGVDTCK